jgi:FkbH-like protein
MANFSWMSLIGTANRSSGVDLETALCALREGLERHPLQGFEITVLADFLKKLDRPSVGYPVKKVAVLGNVTTQPVEDAMALTLFAEGYLAEIYSSPFSTYQQEALDSNSALYKFEPDLIMIYTSGKNIVAPGVLVHGEEDLKAILDAQWNHWRGFWESLKTNSNAKILQHTYASPDQKLCGVAESRGRYSGADVYSQVNRHLMNSSSDSVYWVDVDHLASDVGRRNWFDPRTEYHGKYPFSLRHLPDYRVLLHSVLREVLGSRPKALVLDLDNTLWGGVIGDDGLSGIALGNNGPEGEAFLAFCEYVLSLSRRGIILGICSKNEPENVREVFEKHPAMPLNLDDFASIKCNWNSKVDNLVEMGRELNIDVSAMVFVDDNPAECELVRQSLPSVRVINMDGDPAEFIRKVEDKRFFEAQHLTSEDLLRVKSYRARLEIRKQKDSVVDIDSFYRSLEMKAEMNEATPDDVPRLEQMEAKTNQFNLATRRLSAADIGALINDPNCVVLTARLADKFADHGLVSYLAAEYNGTTCVVTDWIMSCRVFSRTLENKLLEVLIDHARAKGAQELVLNYSPTPKNQLMVDIFRRLGFSEQECGSGSWRQSLNDLESMSSVIELD